MERPLKTHTEIMRELVKLRHEIAKLEQALGESPALPPPTVRSGEALQAEDFFLRRSNGGPPSDPAASPEGGVAASGEQWPTEKQSLECVLASTPTVLWVVDREGVVRRCEGSGLTALRVMPDEAMGRHFEDVFGSVSGTEGLLRRTFAGETVRGLWEFEDRVTFRVWCVPLRDETGAVTGAIGLGVDVTDLNESGRRLFAEQQSTEALLHSHEQDRRLIAYEIHDGFVQEATGAMLRLETLLETGRIPEGTGRQEVEISLQLIRKAVAEARRLISGLRPPVLEELGVVAAIEFLIDDQPPGGPSIDFRADVSFARLEPLLEGTVYRIVQEAITNIRRHSGSDRAQVRLTQFEDHLHVEVRDWGVGFDPKVIEGKRFGLRGICERARLLGGRAEIDSAPGKGTRIFVDLPLARAPREVATI